MVNNIVIGGCKNWTLWLIQSSYSSTGTNSTNAPTTRFAYNKTSQHISWPRKHTYTYKFIQDTNTYTHNHNNTFYNMQHTITIAHKISLQEL